MVRGLGAGGVSNGSCCFKNLGFGFWVDLGVVVLDEVIQKEHVRREESVEAAGKVKIVM
jgi:hypothetical protein